MSKPNIKVIDLTSENGASELTEMLKGVFAADMARKKMEQMAAEMSDIAQTFTEKLCALADKYGAERQQVMTDAVHILIDTVILLDFDTYDLETGNVKFKGEQEEES